MIREAAKNDLNGLLKLYMQLHDNPFPEIDEKLNETARGWSTERFGSAELAILRVACY